MSSIIKLQPNDPLTEDRFKEVCEKLKKALSGRCQKAFLFGSTAKGCYTTDSDIDIILIKNTNVPFTKRALEFEDLLDIFSLIDILVYTPEEFEKKMESKSFPQDISNHLIPLI